LSDTTATQRLDFAVLEHLIRLVGSSTKELEWLIEQQAHLRTEYLTFYKKDLKEIFAGLQEIMPTDASSGSATALSQTLVSIIDHHRRDLDRSYQLIDGRFLELRQDEVERGVRLSIADEAHAFRENFTDNDAKKALASFAEKLRSPK
jgi:hypothetical protein